MKYIRPAIERGALPRPESQGVSPDLLADPRAVIAEGDAGSDDLLGILSDGTLDDAPLGPRAD
jgi:hypothetical protein